MDASGRRWREREKEREKWRKEKVGIVLIFLYLFKKDHLFKRVCWAEREVNKNNLDFCNRSTCSSSSRRRRKGKAKKKKRGTSEGQMEQSGC